MLRHKKFMLLLTLVAALFFAALGLAQRITSRDPVATDFGMATRNIPIAAASTTLLNAVTTTGASSGADVSRSRGKSLYVTITGTATVALETAPEDVAGSYVSLGSVTATGKIANDDADMFARANVTVCTACTVTAKLVK